ncbi:hypothetical protein CYLTODRAFT_405329 [Cylindrobasidium torrendii FP15055 ss-10]|uniref:T6SS Phospholipase effector Tle1-like catalytic domain-containing protein n=1 Tax=Cylindrobasidium torrendii FP15055 ss-10 TaxID=1314674 RepID=A0A0D7ATQ0_9AGAR|nr:hypothetical protein CYLTODRAFT_405329 [Cylindrobasidium torrendii FP15055 ss-10]
MSLRASTSNGHVLEPSTAETLVNFDCNLVPDTPPTEENTPLPDLPNIRTGPYANGSQLPPRIPLTARPESTLSLPRSSYTPIRREATMSLDSSPFVIPPTHEHRTLVLCFDGTGDQFDADNSNIVEFFSMLKKDDRREQMCYYQSGIGTYISPKAASPTSATLAKSLDMMMAWHLDAHVMDGYEFLMQNYQTGDRICLFGFSRGAYTARGLAGMLHKVGLLLSPT